MPTDEHLQHIAQGGKPPQAATPDGPQNAIVVKGIWLRVNTEGYIEVIAETLRGWQTVITEKFTSGSGPISHIVEPAGIENAPFDPIATESSTHSLGDINPEP